MSLNISPYFFLCYYLVIKHKPLVIVCVNVYIYFKKYNLMWLLWLNRCNISLGQKIIKKILVGLMRNYVQFNLKSVAADHGSAVI